MEASIRDNNIKHFLRMLQCASRFGDDLHMHAHKEMWEFAVTNSTKSAFFIAKLKPPFFSRFKPLGETNVEKRRGVRCQLYAKSVLAVLGKATSAAMVERIDLKIIDNENALRKKRKRQRSETHTPREEDEYEQSDDDAGGIEAKLQIKLVCRHGVIKRHSLHVGTSEFLRAEVDPNSTPSSFQVSARSLRDFLDHFSAATPGFERSHGGIPPDPHLGWMMGKKQIRMKTWETGQSNLSTEIKLDPGEFDYYWLEGDRVDFSVPMKEFRAMLALGEQLSIQLNVAYSIPGQPLTISSLDDANDADADRNPKYDLFCAIATAACTAFSNVPLEEKPTVSRTTSDTSAIPRSSIDSSRTTDLRRSTDFDGSGSTPQQKRKRSTLSMSTERHATGTVIRNSVSHELTTSNEDHAPAGGADGYENETTKEPLFMSNSQEEQKLSLTQREALEVAGLDDLDNDDLLGVLEDGDEEYERERQEEAASQRQARVEGQGGMEMDGTLGGIPAIHGPAGGGNIDMTVEPGFELDTDIFGDNPADASAVDDGVEEAGGNEVQPGGTPDGQKKPSQNRAAGQQGEDEDDEMEEDFGQSQVPGHNSRSFTTFFDD